MGMPAGSTAGGVKYPLIPPGTERQPEESENGNRRRGVPIGDGNGRWGIHRSICRKNLRYCPNRS